MIDKTHLRHLITKTLERLDMNSEEAVELLLGTAAVESELGTFFYQNEGPALGIFQMEPNTQRDIWGSYLFYRTRISDNVKKVTGVSNRDNFSLMTNIAYQVAMARIHYRRVKEKLPEVGDVNGQARYWKKYYNTKKGKGTVRKYVDKHELYLA